MPCDEPDNLLALRASEFYRDVRGRVAPLPRPGPRADDPWILVMQRLSGGGDLVGTIRAAEGHALGKG
jgi:hypothetical protein